MYVEFMGLGFIRSGLALGLRVHVGFKGLGVWGPALTGCVKV